MGSKGKEGGMNILGSRGKEGDMLLGEPFHHPSESDLGIPWQSGFWYGLGLSCPCPCTVSSFSFYFAYGVICIILSSQKRGILQEKLFHLSFV